MTEGKLLSADELAALRNAAEKATPGPWSLCDEGLGIWCPSAKGGETKIFDVRGWGYLTGGGHGALGLPSDKAEEIQRANGTLAASAPQLLDHITVLTTELDRWRRSFAGHVYVKDEDYANVCRRAQAGRVLREAADRWAHILDNSVMEKEVALYDAAIISHITVLTKERDEWVLQCGRDSRRIIELIKRAEAAEAELALIRGRLLPDGCVAVCQMCGLQPFSKCTGMQVAENVNADCPLKPKEPK